MAEPVEDDDGMEGPSGRYVFGFTARLRFVRYIIQFQVNVYLALSRVLVILPCILMVSSHSKYLYAFLLCRSEDFKLMAGPSGSHKAVQRATRASPEYEGTVRAQSVVHISTTARQRTLELGTRVSV